jgi:hypothetical protein
LNITKYKEREQEQDLLFFLLLFSLLRQKMKIGLLYFWRLCFGLLLLISFFFLDSLLRFLFSFNFKLWYIMLFNLVHILLICDFFFTWPFYKSLFCVIVFNLIVDFFCFFVWVISLFNLALLTKKISFFLIIFLHFSFWIKCYSFLI